MLKKTNILNCLIDLHKISKDTYVLTQDMWMVIDSYRLK